MIERPILFSAPMVRALLSGTKTQTRRVVKNPPSIWTIHSIQEQRCPYGQAGDRLWVRETWAKWGRDDQCGEGPSQTHEPIYRADSYPWDWGDKWRPSIYMPRWASRITLEIIAVRVERLQDISSADAIAEGIEPCASGGEWRNYLDSAPNRDALTPRVSYRSLWESINGPGSWAANPWVWVVEFKRMAP